MYQQIEIADPLNVNEIMRSLPFLNEREDIEALKALLSELLSRFDSLTVTSPIDACAVVRDIGFVMSSIRKAGIQPQTVNDGLSARMLGLSKITGMVPRDTVYHYSIWNPEGRYQRLFTNFDDEKGLIKSVRLSIVELEECIDKLTKAIAIRPFAADFSDYLLAANTSLRNSIGTLAIAIKQVHPRIFSVNLRPYFDPIDIDGKSYIASGGGQIPMFLVDKMVWVENDRSDLQNAYFNFINESAVYLPPFLRVAFNSTCNGLPLTGMLAEAKSRGLTVDSKNELAVKMLLKNLIAFRQAHAHYAAKSFTPENIGRYKTGSGGFEMSFVDQLLNLTKDVLSDIEKNNFIAFPNE